MVPWNKGKHLSEEQIIGMSERGKLLIGEKNPFFGRKHSEKTILGMTGENNPAWKGDSVGYAALHDWLEKRMPKPDSCPECHTPAECKECHRRIRLEIANITGIYNRELKNWKWLCTACHRKYDSYPRDPITGRFIAHGRPRICQ